MPRRLRQPDRIDNIFTDSFHPYSPSLPPSHRPDAAKAAAAAANARRKGKGNFSVVVEWTAKWSGLVEEGAFTGKAMIPLFQLLGWNR